MRKLLIIASIVTAVVVADVALERLAFCSCGWQIGTVSDSIVVFVILISAAAISQYLILAFSKRPSDNSSAKSAERIGLGGNYSIPSGVFHNAISAIQYLLIALLFAVSLQLLLQSSYHLHLVTTTTAISYLLALFLMVLLSYRFFIWFIHNRSRGNIAVLLYGLSSAVFSLSTAVAIVTVYVISQSTPIEEVHQFVTTIITSDQALNTAYTISSVVGFGLIWCATAIVLHPFSKRIGGIKYWLLISTPLVYFAGQFLTLAFDELAFAVAQYPIVAILLFVFTKPVGGILFGAAFWTTVRKSTPSGSVLRKYMSLAACGIMIFFITGQNTVAQPNYPPFGFISATFLGLSAYLMFWGVYASAISISQDTKLRKTILKSTLQESRLLGSIGTSQMEQELQARVLTLARKNSDIMSEETGVQPSLSEDEIKQYLDEVINEIKISKT